MGHKVLFFIYLMSDILKLLNTLSLQKQGALEKQGALLGDIMHIIRITLGKLQKLTEVTTSKHFQEVLFSTHSFYSSYQKYLCISQEFQNDRRNLRSQGRQITIETFHSVITINKFNC